MNPSTSAPQTSADAPDTGGDLIARIEALWVYPIKSCAGVALTESEITIDGLLWDRNWMVVDRDGEAITQREAPRMALIQTDFRMGALRVRAPGMLPLHLNLDSAETQTRVRLWGEALSAYEMGRSLPSGSPISSALATPRSALCGWSDSTLSTIGTPTLPGPATRRPPPSSPTALGFSSRAVPRWPNSTGG